MTGKAKAAVNRIKALAYLRTSAAQNVGGDSDQRQREAIARFARVHGYELAGEFYDMAVSGADPIETRPGFAAMLERIEADGVRVVLVEDASRFARSVIAQELGVLAMQARGVAVLTASGDNLTETDDPAKVVRLAETGENPR
jgi:DNA invertase Pin-like site-specific DNA recombinase